MRKFGHIALFGALVLSTTSALAKDDKLTEARPPIFEELVNCRTIADPTERLA